MNWASILLVLAAIYCAGMYLFCVYRMFRFREDHEAMTFYLGLCFILAVGFLSLGGY